MKFQRSIYTAIEERLDQGSSLIQVIAGPRQVGKTTIVKQLFQSKRRKGIYHIADGLMSNGAVWLENIFNEAQLWQNQSNIPVVLAIDEIQKIPNWSEVIKRLVDQQKFSDQKAFPLILLGSSHWLMQKGLSESLAGRFEQWNLGHWTYSELKSAFDISPEEYVYFGAYPGSYEFYRDEERWKSYVRNSLIETVITKDVLLMHRIEKPALLRSLFELGIQYSGQILSYTKLMGQMQEAKNTTTIAHYLNLLAQAGLLCGLQKFAMDKARQRSSSPKWQVMNNALMSALGSETFEEAPKQLKSWGRRVESAIGAHLLSYQKEDLKLFYWNESNAEVDFVLQWKGQYVGLEVKTSKDKVSGLARFSQQFKPHKIYQLNPAGLSWQQLIAMDPRALF